MSVILTCGHQVIPILSEPARKGAYCYCRYCKHFRKVQEVRA
jgi:hypothetical protein